MTNSDSSVVPSEVGWQFVPQYYTFVNKHPQRLHCFYTKTSTFIHGTEGEEITPCHGQQEIHAKITSIGFEDCKVFIHSVDAQSSANGGIILQVIGEMSNNAEPWRKFVQTFFLAEQPNGYFVLNDIFRFLKEESPEGDEASEAESDAAATEESPAVPTFDTTVEAPGTQTVSAPVEEPAVEETAVSLPQSVALSEPNGIHADEPEPEARVSPVASSAAQPSPAPPPSTTLPPLTTTEAEPSPSPSPAPPSAPAPAPEPSQPPPAASSAPAPAPPAATRSAAPAAAPAAAPSQPSAPPAPKTWAHLAAANSKKWGTAVAVESKGTSEAPITTSAPGSGAGTPTSAAPVTRAPPQGQRSEHPAYLAAQSLTTPQCFVKGVLETLTQANMTNTLTQRFGPIKDLEIVRSKACAFLEFTTLEAAKKAITSSLPLSQGGEGGIRIDVGGGEHQRITVETRKERGDRPVSRPRGGSPLNGDRGSFRGRGGGAGRGRGVPNK